MKPLFTILLVISVLGVSCSHPHGVHARSKTRILSKKVALGELTHMLNNWAGIQEDKTLKSLRHASKHGDMDKLLPLAKEFVEEHGSLLGRDDPNWKAPKGFRQKTKYGVKSQSERAMEVKDLLNILLYLLTGHTEFQYCDGSYLYCPYVRRCMRTCDHCFGYTQVNEEQSCCESAPCEYTEWVCSVSCGLGMATRIALAGDNCRDTQKECQQPQCEVPCEYSEFSAWSEWSAECGGTRTRTRTVLRGNAAVCMAIEETEMDDPCPPTCNYGAWGAWGPCSAECDGTYSRSRVVAGPPESTMYCHDTTETGYCSDPCPACPMWTCPKKDAPVESCCETCFPFTYGNEDDCSCTRAPYHSVFKKLVKQDDTSFFSRWLQWSYKHDTGLPTCTEKATLLLPTDDAVRALIPERTRAAFELPEYSPFLRAFLSIYLVPRGGRGAALKWPATDSGEQKVTPSLNGDLVEFFTAEGTPCIAGPGADFGESKANIARLADQDVVQAHDGRIIKLWDLLFPLESFNLRGLYPAFCMQDKDCEKFPLAACTAVPGDAWGAQTLYPETNCAQEDGPCVKVCLDDGLR